MTPATLRSRTAKDLAQMAKNMGVPGWHAMRKDQLVRALVKLGKRKTAKKKQNKSVKRDPVKRNSVKRNSKTPSDIARGSTSKRAVSSGIGVSKASGASKASDASKASKTDPRIRQRIQRLQSKLERIKNLGVAPIEGSTDKDRLVVMVRDPYWLHAYWELSPRSIERARASLAQSWHTAQPVLRLYLIEDDGTEKVIRNIDIHGGVNNWYLDVQDPPKTYRLEIGYLSRESVFYCLARSNAVTTPPSSKSDAVDENWAAIAEDADRIYAMSGGYSPHGTSLELQELLEERLRRPMGSPMKTRYGAGAMDKESNLDFAVDAEIIVYGISHHEAHVTLKGEPIELRPDGSFTARLNLPNRRQVIPVVASSADGVEQQTIVIAIERNTKVMEPIVRDVMR